MSREKHYEKGMEHFTRDEIDLAIRELSKALELDSNYADTLHALAMCYYHQGDFDKAIRFGERLTEVDPSEILAYTSLSMFYNAKGMIAKAEEMGAKAQALGVSKALGEKSQEKDE